MFEKLQSIEDKFCQLELTLQDSNLYSDPKRAADLLRDQKEMLPVVEAYRAYKQTQADLETAVELSKDSDPEMREMGDMEAQEAREKLKAIEQQIKLILLPKDENADKNVIIEIRGGVGGEEASLFAASLYRMYSMYADTHHFKIEVLNVNETELMGIKEISFLVEGKGAWARFKYESGTHRVQRVPETESSGRIHTSVVTVAVLPEAEDVEIEINPADLQVDTYRSSGAGGQHVNKTESAIRITHVPSGLVVECQEERSQHKNRDKAMRLLKSRLYEAEQEKLAKERAGERKSQVGTGDRAERIRTYNYPQGRMTDHRIGLTLYKLEQILNGDLDETMDALAAAEQAEKLQAAGDNI